MFKAGFPVPFGFCITTESYKDFIDYNNLPSSMADLIKDVNPDNIQEKGSQLRMKIENAIIPQETEQDTFLNIQGQENILDLVRNCWASLFTDRAILYRIQNNIPHKKAQMSVVVQKMVFPDVSGIMFTADPITCHRDRISIDASYGLGEALSDA